MAPPYFDNPMDDEEEQGQYPIALGGVFPQGPATPPPIAPTHAFSSPTAPEAAPMADTPLGTPQPDMDSELKAKIAAMQQKYQTDALASNATPELSPTQAIAASVLKVAPMLLGMAIAKNRNIGISAGANAGLETGAAFEKQSLDQQKDKANRSAVLAQQDLKDISTKEGERFQLGKQGMQNKAASDLATNEGKIVSEDLASPYAIDQANKGKRAKDMGPKGPESPFDKEQIKDIKKYAVVAQSAQSAINQINKLVPELARSESYTNPDGSISLKNSADILARRGLDLLAGSETPSGRARDAVTAAAKAAVQAMSGLSYTDKDFDKTAEIVKGSGWATTTFPSQVWLLKRFVQLNRASANTDIDATQALRGANPKEAFNKVFDDITNEETPSIAGAAKHTSEWAASQGYSPAEIKVLQSRGLIE